MRCPEETMKRLRHTLPLALLLAATGAWAQSGGSPAPRPLAPEVKRELEQMLLAIKPRYEEYQQALVELNELNARIESVKQAMRNNTAELREDGRRKAALMEKYQPLRERIAQASAQKVDSPALRQEADRAQAEMQAHLVASQALVRRGEALQREFQELTAKAPQAEARLKRAMEALGLQ